MKATCSSSGHYGRTGTTRRLRQEDCSGTKGLSDRPSQSVRPRRRLAEFAAWAGRDKDKALDTARQITGATEGMLTKQLGGAVAGGIAKVVEAIATMNSDLGGVAAATWANFFGDEEGKAQACEWKEKEKDWD
eukprot:16416328-Heterocapsa_arctica.AAC.1